ADEADEAVEDKLDQLGSKLDEINDRPQAYDPEQKTIAGVFATLSADGKLQVEAGFVRPEDELGAEDGETGEGDDGDAGSDAVDGGANGVVVNGKPANGASADGGDCDEVEEDGIKPL